MESSTFCHRLTTFDLRNPSIHFVWGERNSLLCPGGLLQQWTRIDHSLTFFVFINLPVFFYPLFSLGIKEFLICRRSDKLEVWLKNLLANLRLMLPFGVNSDQTRKCGMKIAIQSPNIKKRENLKSNRRMGGEQVDRILIIQDSPSVRGSHF